MNEPEDFVACRICGKRYQQIQWIHLRTHNITLEEYRNEFPEAPTISGKTRKMFSVANRGKNNSMYGKARTKEVRAKISATLTGRIRSEKSKAKQRATMNHPEYRVRHSGKNNPSKRPEVKAKISAAIKVIMSCPEIRAKNREVAIKQWEALGYRDKHSGENHHMYGKIHTEKTRAKISAALVGENNPNFRNWASRNPYCYKWSPALREQVRNHWGRVCLNCGKSEIENGRRLSVHHIDGNKMQGCDGHDWFLVPLCLSCNSKKLEDDSFCVTLFMFKDLERKTREQHINGS